jgi:hypothetical protein
MEEQEEGEYDEKKTKNTKQVSEPQTAAQNRGGNPPVRCAGDKTTPNMFYT